jgi:hypothetical protein
VSAVYALIYPAPEDLDDDQAVRVSVKVLDVESEAHERARELAAEHGSCAVVRRPTEVRLATGDARPVCDHYSNGYRCPWCGCGVPDRRADPGCVNPQCLANAHWSASAVAAGLERRAEAELREAERHLRAEWSQRYVAEQRAEREARWAESVAEAERRGACLECLGKSDWDGGRPKYIRHRRPDCHDRTN